MATTTDRAYGEAEIKGVTACGEAETTVLRIVDNPSWTPDEADSEHRYYVLTLLDDHETANDGYDDLDEARAYLIEQAREYRELYADNLTEARSALSATVGDAASDWTDGPDRQVVRALAKVILNGKAAQALAALKAAGLA